MGYLICFSQTHQVDTTTSATLQTNKLRLRGADYVSSITQLLNGRVGLLTSQCNFGTQSLNLQPVPGTVTALLPVSTRNFQCSFDSLRLFTSEVFFPVSPAHRLTLHFTLAKLLASTYLKYTSEYILLLLKSLGKNEMRRIRFKRKGTNNNKRTAPGFYLFWEDRKNCIFYAELSPRVLD